MEKRVSPMTSSCSLYKLCMVYAFTSFANFSSSGSSNLLNPTFIDFKKSWISCWKLSSGFLLLHISFVNTDQDSWSIADITQIQSILWIIFLAISPLKESIVDKNSPLSRTFSSKPLPSLYSSAIPIPSSVRTNKHFSFFAFPSFIYNHSS